MIFLAESLTEKVIKILQTDVMYVGHFLTLRHFRDPYKA